jgi:hypothetical protein
MTKCFIPIRSDIKSVIGMRVKYQFRVTVINTLCVFLKHSHNRQPTTSVDSEKWNRFPKAESHSSAQ